MGKHPLRYCMLMTNFLQPLYLKVILPRYSILISFFISFCFCKICFSPFFLSFFLSSISLSFLFFFSRDSISLEILPGYLLYLVFTSEAIASFISNFFLISITSFLLFFHILNNFSLYFYLF